MGGKIKKLLRTFLSNKKFFFLTLGLILFLFLVPSHIVQAGFWDGLISIATGFGEKLIELFFGIATNILGLIFGAISGLLNWAINNLMSIPVSPSHPEIVSIVRDGWALSRNIVNLFFILILVFIGLATILRLQTYQAQKTLPALIIIAILVNFSGILVGFVVDMGNIVANFFLSSTVKSTTWFMDWPGAESGSGLLALLTYYLGKSSYYVIASLIYFIVFLLFFVRVFILWTLAILAPFAFAAYILPATKKWWTQWLQQLIQWSIIGIPIGFFLYLSSQAIRLSAGDIYPPGVDPGPLAAFMAPVTALFLLFIGITLSMQMAPSGAQGVINFGKKTGMAAGKWAGGKGLAAAREKVPESWRTRMESMSASKNPKWGEGRKGILGYAMRGTAGLTGFAQRGMGGLAAKTVIGGEKEAASKAQTEAKERDVMGNLGALRQAQTKAERLGIIKAMIEKKQMRDALNPDVAGKNALTTEEAFGAYEKAGQFKDRDATEDMEFSFIHMKGMADKMAGFVDNETAGSIKEEDRTGKQYGRPSGLTEDDIKKGYTSYKDKVIRSAKTTDDMKKFNKSLWKQDDAVESALYFERNQIAAATTQFSRTFSDPLQAAAEAKGAKWFYKINPVTGKMNAPYLPKYFASTAAQGSYMPLDGAETVNKIKLIEQRARKEQKSYLERELTTATGTRASDIRREIAEIERLEREERKVIVAPKIEDEIPLTVQMKNAGGEKKKILQRAFDRRPVLIQKEEDGISGIDDAISQNEKAARGATEEVSRMLRIEGLRETDQPVKDKRDEIKSLASQLKTMRDDRDIRMEAWHDMMDAWRSQSPESFIAQDIIKLREEEKVANEALVKMKTLGKPKDVIERAGKDLERIKDVKHGRESELALHLRSKATNLQTVTRESQMAQFRTAARRLDVEIDAAAKEIESIDKGSTYQKERLDSVKKERAGLSAQIQTEILKTRPEWTTVPSRILKERERLDPRFRPLDEEIKTAQKTVDVLESNRRSREKTLKELRTNIREATGKYNALTREGQTTRQTTQGEIEKIKEEMKKIIEEEKESS